MFMKSIVECDFCQHTESLDDITLMIDHEKACVYNPNADDKAIKKVVEDMKDKQSLLCSNCKQPYNFCICPEGCIDWDRLKKGLEEADRQMDEFRESQKISFEDLHRPFDI